MSINHPVTTMSSLAQQATSSTAQPAMLPNTAGIAVPQTSRRIGLGIF